MGSRIVLISLNRYTSPDPVFPLGLTHLSGALRQAGHQIRWIDCQVDGERIEQILTEYRPRLVGLSLRNIDDVLIGKRQSFWDDLVSTCRRVRGSVEAPIVLGGSGFSIFPRPLMECTGADFGIGGEGEMSLVALVEALASGGDHSAIPGLVFRRGNELVINPQQPTPPSQRLELADWPEHLVAHYLKGSGMLNVQTQRGCGFHCCYCTYPVIEGQRHRRRPPEEVAADLERVSQLGAKYAFIVDSVFNSSPTHVAETCEAILRRGPRIRWGCFLRPAGLSQELMALMARAGLSHIEFGSDSFCDAVLASYGKSFGFDDILQASRLAAEQKIDSCHFLICGGPGETLETLQAGFDNSHRLPPGIVIAVVGMRIYPGTPLFERALAETRVTPEQDLLTPTYYLADGLTEAGIFERLRRFAASSPNWIVGDPDPNYVRMAQRLRQRGVVGPLWSYYSTIQRLWPPP